MQNAESYVALGRDNSGAAAIPRSSNPMTGAFAVYDAQQAGEKKRKNALIDSLGNDLAGITGQAWEIDFPEINAERDKFLMMKADYMARGVDISKDPKAYLAIQQQRQKVIDLASKSKMDRQTYQGLVTDIRNNPELYDPEEVKKFEEQWAKTPVSKRTKETGLKQIPDTKWIPAIQQAAGVLYDSYSIEKKLPDGTSKTISGTSLNNERLNENFAVFWEDANSEYAPLAYRQFKKAIENRVKSEAAAQGKDWDTLPVDIKVQAVTAEAKKQFAIHGKADEQVKRASSLTGKAEGGLSFGSGGSVTKDGVTYNTAVVQDPVTGPMKVYETWTFADKPGTENKVHTFRVGRSKSGGIVEGYPRMFRKLENGKPGEGEIVLYIPKVPAKRSDFGIIQTPEVPAKEMVIPVTPENQNLDVIISEYGFDPITWRNDNVPDYQERIEKSKQRREEFRQKAGAKPIGTAPASKPPKDLKSLPGVVSVRSSTK